MQKNDNTRADCRYIFRVTNGTKWKPLGQFVRDEIAQHAARDLYGDIGGRLAVVIGDFAFPVGDLEPGGGGWLKRCKARKAYDTRQARKYAEA